MDRVTNRRWRRILWIVVCSGFVFLSFRYARLAFQTISFTQSVADLDTYGLIEITARVQTARASNPFTDSKIQATFETQGGKRWQVDGFCDSEDGSIFRVRFMPPVPGDYKYSVKYSQSWHGAAFTGSFHAKKGLRRGPIRVDPRNRWHFIWEGTGEHYYFNGTTAYWLAGWRDEAVIRSSIDRLHRMKTNRIRVTLAGRTDLHYGEPVMAGDNWTPLVTPWPANRTSRFLHLIGRFGQRYGKGFAPSLFDSLAGIGMPQDVYNPGFDYSRFQVSYWQKFDRLLEYARDRDMIISVVLDMNDSHVHPGADTPGERQFLKYAVARFSAYSNVTWDLGDDLDRYRDDRWTHDTGMLIKQWDPYRHLATSHPVDNIHQDRGSDWFDFTSLQEWSRNQHKFMLEQRELQRRLGRIIPQTNEEYGYEDHYPMWAKGPGSDSTDTLRRTAWEIAMAGGYQTAGETARQGTNVWPDTGGGWVNGRGDGTMTMLLGYAHMADFFTSFEWWKAEPHDELVDNGYYCLAEPGRIYAIYLPKSGPVTVHLQPGSYGVTWWNPVTGERTLGHSISILSAEQTWQTVSPSARQDWALLLRASATAGQ